MIIKYRVKEYNLTDMETPTSFCCSYMRKRFDDGHHWNLYAEHKANRLEHQCEECVGGAIPFKFCPNCGKAVTIEQV